MRLSDDILGKNPGSWVKFLIGLFGVPACFVILTFVYGLIIGFLESAGLIEYSTFEILLGMDFAGSVESLFFAFWIVGGFHIVLYVFFRLVYGRSYISVINPFDLDWRLPCLMGVLYVFAYLLISDIVGLLSSPINIEVSVIWQPKLWVIWLIPMSIAIFLQSSAEELFFRGFMQQYLGRLIKQRWVYLVVPSLIWAGLHWWNLEGFWLRLAATISIFIMGIVFADWADISGSLWGPIAAHFTNNFILVCVYGNSIEPSEMMIWRADYAELSNEQLAIYTMVGAVIMAVVYAFMRKHISRPPHSDA